MAGEVEQLRISLPRLWARIEELGEVGAVHGPNGERGCARLALTDADRDGRDLVARWMRDLGLAVSIDGIGNVVATRPGAEPGAQAVMTGSHIDTVVTGGRFDGNLGVLAGLEVLETLAANRVVTRRPISVAFFTDEEGSRFQPDMLGSLVYVGGMPLEEALDLRAVDDGARVGDELHRIGYEGSLPCPAPVAPFAYVELHIEQGPILEAEGVQIGVVTGVQGISWTEVSIDGSSAHAGTTPMSMRKDAGVAAARLTTAVRDIADEFAPDQVATVGRCELVPNLVNVVPGAASVTVDLRNIDDAVLRRAELRLDEVCREITARDAVDIGTRSLARFDAVDFDPSMIDLVESTAVQLGYSTRRLPSGAGHDAQMLARICPSAMIFTPSVAGLSHNIAEFTDQRDVEAGANVLLHVLLGLAEPIQDDPAS